MSRFDETEYVFFMNIASLAPKNGSEEFRQRNSVARMRLHGKAQFVMAGLLWVFLPSCTLLSVGRFVKNEYAPALAKSDTRRLASLSTAELADVYSAAHR
jgi:hypothetical protein